MARPTPKGSHRALVAVVAAALAALVGTPKLGNSDGSPKTLGTSTWMTSSARSFPVALGGTLVALGATRAVEVFALNLDLEVIRTLTRCSAISTFGVRHSRGCWNQQTRVCLC